MHAHTAVHGAQRDFAAAIAGLGGARHQRGACEHIDVLACVEFDAARLGARGIHAPATSMLPVSAVRLTACARTVSDAAT